VGGKVVLEHDLTPQHLTFASITRGYKGGGINIDARINPPADPLTYDSETLWNYEVGVRGSWLEQRLIGELTGFYLDRRQTQVRDSAGFGGNYRFFTDNGRGAHVYGLEASGRVALSQNSSLQASASRLESNLESFQLGNGNTGGGRRLANTPRYGYSLAARYRPAQGFFGQLEMVNRAEQFDSNNQNEARRSFTLLHATAGYAWGRWSLTLWARNVLNKTHDKRVFYFGNEDPDYIPARYEDRADPRQVGVTAAYRF
jgi:outer membrane receptor protein involved in Fe transport